MIKIYTLSLFYVMLSYVSGGIQDVHKVRYFLDDSRFKSTLMSESNNPTNLLRTFASGAYKSDFEQLRKDLISAKILKPCGKIVNLVHGVTVIILMDDTLSTYKDPWKFIYRICKLLHQFAKINEINEVSKFYVHWLATETEMSFLTERLHEFPIDGVTPQDFTQLCEKVSSMAKALIRPSVLVGNVWYSTSVRSFNRNDSEKDLEGNILQRSFSGVTNSLKETIFNWKKAPDEVAVLVTPGYWNYGYLPNSTKRLSNAPYIAGGISKENIKTIIKKKKVTKVVVCTVYAGIVKFQKIIELDNSKVEVVNACSVKNDILKRTKSAQGMAYGLSTTPESSGYFTAIYGKRTVEQS